MRWVIAPLTVLAVWMAVMLYVFRPLSDRIAPAHFGTISTVYYRDSPFIRFIPYV